MRRLDVLRFPSPIGELHFSIFFCFSFPLPVSYCFRPLSGSYISQWGFQILQKEEQTCFRPLSGSYISQSCFFISLSYSSLVSVPYRGATFLNNAGRSGKDKKGQFPSPIGELHFSIDISRPKSSRKTRRFPSPIGELHFSIELAALNGKGVNIGFRPLSGSYISQLFSFCFRSSSIDRFRPLSGSYISQ